MTNSPQPLSTDEIQKLYIEAFKIYDKERKTPEIEVSFYPYVGINHTIRIRKDVFLFELAKFAATCRLRPIAHWPAFLLPSFMAAGRRNGPIRCTTNI